MFGRLDVNAEISPASLVAWSQFWGANYVVLPGDDLDEALSLELVRRSSECECSPSSHWREDSQGNERRIVCGCGCEACSEF
jgi:hypothetical protein